MLNQAKLTRKESIWIGIIFWAVMFTAAEAPFTLAFNTRFQNWQIWTDVTISLLFIADLIYHIKRYRKKNNAHFYQTSEQKWKAYFGFFISALACIPFDVIFYMFGLGSANKLLKLLRIFRLIRIVKLITLFSNLPTIPRTIRVLLVFVGSLMMMHFLSCFWVYLHPPPNKDFTAYYIECFYWTITTLTTVGYGDITPTTTVARLYTMVVMMGGVGFYGLVIGNITRIFAEEARYKEQTREKFSELSAFMKHYHIPDRLQNSVFNYYNHIYSKHLSDNDQKIISDLPHALKDELQVYMNMKLVRNLPVFRYCSHTCLKAVASALKQEHYGPGDTIIRIGEIGNEMFLIGHGIVDIILKNGNTVAQLHEGQFFGEVALLKETTRNANVRAASYCDLYRLPKDQFLSIIKDHPELFENIEKITKQRVSK